MDRSGVHRSVRRQNTSGGSAGAGGYNFQAEASAAVEAKILAGEALNWAETGCSQVPVSLLAETGGDGDDLRVGLENGALIEIQAKKGVQKGEKLWSALIDLAQAVARKPGVFGVLLTDSSASQTVSQDLRRDLIRVGQGRTDDLRTITKEFLKRLKDAGLHDHAGCCARLRIVSCDFQPGSSGEESVRATLRTVVYDPTRVASAHATLSKDGASLIELRGRRDKRAITELLSAVGIATTPSQAGGLPPAFQAAVAEFASQWASSLAVVSSAETRAQEELLSVRTDALIDEVRQLLTSRDFAAVSLREPELRRWIATHGTQIPPGKLGEAYAVVVEVELQRVLQDEPESLATGTDLLEDMIGEGERALSAAPAPDKVSTQQQLFSLKAFVASLKHGPANGLSMLAERDDPFAVRRRLAILNRAGRFKESAEEASRRELHREWVDKAVGAYASADQPTDALAVIRWAKTRLSAAPSLAAICAITACDAVCGWGKIPGGEELRTIFEPITPEREAKLRQGVTFLNEVTNASKVLGQARSLAEVEALSREAVLLARLGDREGLTSLVPILSLWTPLPILLIDLAQRDLIEADPDWPDRLRREYAGDFTMEISASLITPIRNASPERRREEFERLYELARTALDPALDPYLRQAIYTHLEILGTGLVDDLASRLEVVEMGLLGDDEAIRRTIGLVRLVNSGSYAEAEDLLTQLENDGLSESDETRGLTALTLQCRAALATHHGRPEEALEHLQRALASAPHPSLLFQAAEAAQKAGQTEEAVSLLERYLKLRPDDDGTRHRLALMFVQRKQFARAASEFGVVWRRIPGDVNRATNYAASLAHSGELEGSLQVYEEICESASPPLQAAIARASIQKALGRPVEAFEGLITFRERWWNEPRYLMVVSEVGYAARQETTAMEALAHVRTLQSEGRAVEGLVRNFTLDEVVGLFSERRQQADDAQMYVIRGELPWLCVDRVLNLGALESWHLRTRPLTWIGEMPVGQAMTAIYATNSFFIDRRAESRRAFRAIPAPQADAPVVADLSALLTLHQLGLLDVTAHYFGQVLLPSVYTTLELEDAGRLVLHQPSQKVALEAIRDAADSGRLSAVPVLTPSQARLSILEDGEWDEGTAGVTYVFSDVLPILVESGLITERQLLEHSHLMKRVSVAQNPLMYGQPLAVDLATLKSLSTTDILDAVIEGFRVIITTADRDAVGADLLAYRRKEEMHTSHRQFWEKIRTDRRFVFVPHSARPEARGHVQSFAPENSDLPRDMEIASAFLAQERNVPLLADDRVCQSLVYGDPKSPSGCYAFGTDRLLLTWMDAGTIHKEAAADHYMNLIRWRYRFLLPSADLLKILAMRHANHPPGKELREVANYAQDCMRDAGLPLEQASEVVTSTLANWLCVSWIAVVVELVCQLWSDVNIPMDKAKLYTEWAMHHLLPASPYNVGAAGSAIFAGLPRTVLTRALVHLVDIRDTGRGNEALRTIARTLGLPKDQFVRTVSEAVNGL